MLALDRRIGIFFDSKNKGITIKDEGLGNLFKEGHSLHVLIYVFDTNIKGFDLRSSED